MPASHAVPLPSVEQGRVVVAAPDRGPGNWAGAPHALLDDGVYWLSYRVRRAIGTERDQTRGVETVVARSEDGERFATVATIERDAFGTDSFERPCLVRRPQGGWRLYVCCATPESKHWWIEAIDADEPSELAGRRENRRVSRLGRARREGSDRRGRRGRCVAGVDLLPSR